MLSQIEQDKLVKFVKTEPRSIQEIAKFIGRSWVTTDSYLKRISNDTGMIAVKTFRKGSHGALKVAYYCSHEPVNEAQDLLERQINSQNFDFFDLYQFAPDDKKKAIPLGKSVSFLSLLEQADESVFFFSGNLSFLSLKEGKISFVDGIEKLLKRKVTVKMLCNLDLSSLNNLAVIEPLLNKYPHFLEIKHCAQPLRGLVVDNKIARFTQEYLKNDYKHGELNSDVKMFFEIYDEEWVAWLKKLFWKYFMSSIDHLRRQKELLKVF
jgi:hypothetical protein